MFKHFYFSSYWHTERVVVFTMVFSF